MFDAGFICPPAPPDILPLDAVLAVGFGWVVVTRDEEVVWSGDDEGMLLEAFESIAATTPLAVWRVRFIGPLSGSTYERVKCDASASCVGWKLIKKDQGFA